MFNDVTAEIRISCDFRLCEQERSFIAANADELLTEVIWRQLIPEAYEWGGYRMAMFAAQFRDRAQEVATKVADLKSTLMKELALPTLRGECFIPAGGLPAITTSTTLTVVFSTFRPKDIGVVDYHGPQRHYGRELVQGIMTCSPKTPPV